MVDIFDSVQTNAIPIANTATDPDSPSSTLLWSRLRILIELLLSGVYGNFHEGTLTSDPPNDTTGYAIDTAAGFTDDEHNGRRIIFTDGNAICQDFLIDDTSAANNRVECTGDNLYSAGARSGDAYLITGNFRDTSIDGHDHDGANSPMITASINRTALKTDNTGLASGTGTGTGVKIVMQDYTFFPSIRQVSDVGLLSWNGSDPGDTVGRFVIDTISSEAYTVRWRYVTATDKPFVYAIRNKNGDIEHVWACGDPPPPYWHMSEPPENFIPPLLFTNKYNLLRNPIKWSKSLFKDKIKQVPEDKQIIIFDYDFEEYHGLMNRVITDRKFLHEMLSKEYELHGNIFRRKNLSMI